MARCCHWRCHNPGLDQDLPVQAVPYLQRRTVQPQGTGLLDRPAQLPEQPLIARQRAGPEPQRYRGRGGKFEVAEVLHLVTGIAQATAVRWRV